MKVNSKLDKLANKPAKGNKIVKKNMPTDMDMEKPKMSQGKKPVAKSKTSKKCK